MLVARHVRSRLPTGSCQARDQAAVPGGLTDVAARSSSSALAVGKTAQSRVLVARWNGAVWKTLSDRALPWLSDLAAAAVFPGGGGLLASTVSRTTVTEEASAGRSSCG